MLGMHHHTIIPLSHTTTPAKVSPDREAPGGGTRIGLVSHMYSMAYSCSCYNASIRSNSDSDCGSSLAFWPTEAEAALECLAWNKSRVYCASGDGSVRRSLQCCTWKIERNRMPLIDRSRRTGCWILVVLDTPPTGCPRSYQAKKLKDEKQKQRKKWNVSSSNARCGLNEVS